MKWDMNWWKSSASSSCSRTRVPSSPSSEPGLRAVVCTDLWYLNDDRLRSRPAVSVGEPELNAYTAFLADKLPDVYSVKDILIVQLDLEGVDLVAACWGRDAIATRQATQVFTERYMSGFCDAVASLMSA